MAIDVRGLPVVLVHGSMHGAWCWDLLLPALAARGVQALTMDLPGHGRRTAEADVASLTTYAESVAAVLDKIDAERVVMVGHSMGGTTASLATALRPNRVSQIVYLSGQVLADGQAPLDTVPPERAVLRSAFATLLRLRTLRPRAEAGRRARSRQGNRQLG